MGQIRWSCSCGVLLELPLGSSDCCSSEALHVHPLHHLTNCICCVSSKEAVGCHEDPRLEDILGGKSPRETSEEKHGHG